jgi:hypothetical protein
MKKFTIVCFLLLPAFLLSAQNRWNLEADGGISWSVQPGESHQDHIEMSGRHISVISTYGVDSEGKVVTSKKLVFPMLRTLPNDTHASFIYTFGTDVQPVIKINNKPVKEQAVRFYHKGILKIRSTLNQTVDLVRELTPSVTHPVAIEKFTLTNRGEKAVTVEVEDFEKITRSQREKSLYDVYIIKARSEGAGLFTVNPGASVSWSMIYSGKKSAEKDIPINPDQELLAREKLIDQFFNTIRFESPDPVLNRMFDFAKIRAMESIFETKGGLLHGPGGGSYYAAIWANDQAEYANPFFAYTGYPTAIESAIVSWRLFAGYMNPEFKPIPSSIIAEGTDFWDGAGDRGDQAMIAYGASRFALALGDKQVAQEIWPLIEWCIEFSVRKINANGVIASDSDELEGRFPAGDANLSTSTLLYDALVSAVYLGKELGVPGKQIKEYQKRARTLRRNIEKFFGAKVEGFDTYRYYEGNDILRSWICLPLVVGIDERAAGTIDALFSPRLWTDDGLLTQAGSATFWDRSTLYGLRGVFAAGETEKALKFFTSYSNRRLLGDHVPYAVEAWPEGNQRHLSAESSLYCRVVTEGIFGFRPTGFNSFTLTPRLPANWNEMALKNMVAFGGKSIDILVNRTPGGIQVVVTSDGKTVRDQSVKEGAILSLSF